MRLSPQTTEPTPSVAESTGQRSLLFENSTLGVATVDCAFRFVSANPEFLNMLGYASDELQQLSFLDICVGEDCEGCRVPLGELRDGARLHYETETTYQRKDGTALP